MHLDKGRKGVDEGGHFECTKEIGGLLSLSAIVDFLVSVGLALESWCDDGTMIFSCGMGVMPLVFAFSLVSWKTKKHD